MSLVTDNELLQEAKKLYELKYNKTKNIVEQIKEKLKFIQDIWRIRNQSITLDYIYSITFALDHYHRKTDLNVYEFNTVHSFLLYNIKACFVFSQKINNKKIACPRDFKNGLKQEYIDNVQKLCDLWDKLGMFFSFEKGLTIYEEKDRSKIKEICSNSIFNFNKVSKQLKTKKQLQIESMKNKRIKQNK